MKLIDTHAHLNFQAYDADREEVIKRTLVSGLEGFEPLEAVINVGARLDSSQKAVEIAQGHNQFYASVGIHPHHTDEVTKDWLESLENLISQPKVVAVGEIGLDYHEYLSGITNPKKQKEIFLAQLDLAKKLKKPVIFHCRDAWPDLLVTLSEFSDLPFGVFHCFSGTLNQAKDLIKKGFYLSFTGNITYKSAGNLREVIKEIPLESILVETDCPYLSPGSLRGLRNEPLYVKMVASKIAEIKEVPLENVVGTTTENAKRLFKLSLD